MQKIFFYYKFLSCLYMFRAPCAHRQEVKIVLYSLWYQHTETSEWSKIIKITKITKIYKYEHMVVEAWNKLIVKQNSVHYKDKYTEMHGQQNIETVYSCILLDV